LEVDYLSLRSSAILITQLFLSNISALTLLLRSSLLRIIKMASNHETCLSVTTDIPVYSKPEGFNDVSTLASRPFTVEPMEHGDCQWGTSSIVLYSDGSYTDIVEIHDTGTWKGDRFIVTRNVKVGEVTVATWNWGEGPYCSNGDSRNIAFQGSHIGIAANFYAITCIQSDCRCSG
jgi:hypothetical protein